MAIPGREPTSNPVNRNTPTVEWTKVLDKPFTGRPPVALPKTKKVVGEDGLALDVPLSPMTIEWWDAVRTMPHAALWTRAEWVQVRSTAMLAEAFNTGKLTAAAELRRREQELGLTAESRRKMRLQYVPFEKPAPKPRASRAKKPAIAPVTQINERRRRSIASQ